MTANPTSPTETFSSSTELAAYEHRSRPAWGAAVIVWEHEGKRGYLFEDGELRVFKDGYFHLMVETDVPTERIARLLESARRAAATSTPGPSPSRKRRGVTLDEQVTLFRESYPEGFAGDAWRAEHRTEKGRAKKRHREPTIERAAETLGAGELELARVAKLLASTDLVPVAEARALGALPDDDAAKVQAALGALVAAADEPGPAFDAWIDALASVTSKPPSWQLATAPLAILRPNQHVCVRSTPFNAQATSMAPRLKLSPSPRHALYERARTMAQRVRERLVDNGMKPADLLDIHDFIRFTLSPSSKKKIAAARDEL